MTRQEFLQDLLDYYTVDPIKRRCMNEAGKCFYTPISTFTDGCAIGRHLDKELQHEFDNDGVPKSVSEFSVFHKLPQWMKDLGQDFLLECQILHDRNQVWRNYINGDMILVRSKIKECFISFNIDLDSLIIKPYETND